MDERVQKLLNHPMRVPATVGVAAFACGLGLGYLIGKRNRYESFIEIEGESHDDPNQLKLEFDSKRLAQELEQMGELESGTEVDFVDISDSPVEVVLETGNETDTPAEIKDFVARKIEEAIASHQVRDEEPEIVKTSVFAGNDDDWDYEKEKASRSADEPYIIHKDEFWADEMGYSQITLTYFAGDGILVDENNVPIYNHHEITGPLLFGHGSGDLNVVHIRNDRRRAEYEVLHDSGLYTVEVLGLEIEDNARVEDLKHSMNRKFKME